ncbi:nuclear receptor coactivator 5 isoform X2 [Hoplias malabaricus]|uniref:nuclear receptor coactivator 5 isoform X2 n=1 Tax=Hoplias malabaricus TaxID=27720 RepID=UPI003462F999
MSHRRSRSGTPPTYGTNSNDPRDLERRIFVGNLPTAHMSKKDMEDLFRPYGKIQEVNMAAERRQKARSSPPRRPAGYGDREPRPRSRSPMHGRDSRDHRDSRDLRDHNRGPPRDHEDDHYRSSEGREKDPRDAPYRDDGSYERGYFRGEYDPYNKKEEPYVDRFREPWNGRREPEEERVRPEERRRNELYRQYYEELQRRYDAERPVDCSVIVVNKQQKEYAETVGRKVRDLGMVVDLIFLNTEVSLTQALEDVSRAQTPFAIIITQQHEVHRSCTVNILFGTPQEHRNMPMQDAMVLVAHNFDSFKVENRAKERDEIARKAAKMADDVLMREHERGGHPVSLLTVITLLAEGRFLTPDELSRLINYLQDKRDRLVGNTDTHLASLTSALPATREVSQPTQALAPASHQTHSSLSTHPIHTSHLPPSSTSSTSQQQELQAKILSLFNSGSGSAVSSSPASGPPPQGYTSGLSQSTGLSSTQSSSGMSTLASGQSPSMLSPRPTIRPPVNRIPAPQGVQRPAGSVGAGINFDNPSVQKALDTLIQSGPALNHLVKSSTAPAAAPRPGQGMGQGVSQNMGQGPPVSHYPRHY